MATSIGRYELRKELGRGGMAAVYLAADTAMERQVALKLMLPQLTADTQFAARFRREARAVAQLEHRGITPVYDYGVHQGRPYLVMRYMSGGSLRDRLHGQPLDPTSVSRLIAELAPALDFAHQKGIIHRDLKPDNILFDENGNPYLSDFGIVKMIEGSPQTLTVTGGILGTPAYMSPEQARGNVELDGRSDVYALGVILFEMLAGTKPYKADTPMGLAMMHVLDPIPRLETFTGSVSPQYQALINKAMAKNRDERFQTAGELAAALTAALSGRPAPTSSSGRPLVVGAVGGRTPTPARPTTVGGAGRTGSVSMSGPVAQATASPTAAIPAKSAKRKMPVWLLAVAGVALIACFGVAAATGVLVLGGDETPTPTPTSTRTVTPTPAESRLDAAGDQLPTTTSTPTPSRTPTPTTPPTNTPINTPTLKPLTPAATLASSTASAGPTATPITVFPTATPQSPGPATNTPRPSTPTNTPVPPTATNTRRPATPTNTPVPPTATNTPPPTATPTIPSPATATPTEPPPPPTPG